MVSPADDRIVIQNESTGEVAHGIRDHIPAGWVKVAPGAPAKPSEQSHSVETNNPVSVRERKTGSVLEKSKVPIVRRALGGKTIKGA